ncbi:bifunctional 5,10-methylenetetrahydrofolate dehydrogenase/5,10-methenyltetrahydrofolate cyclohydrolase [uncultured Veillonella sp.]|uniref:bifunctional 5,10-methylenetetrahydrofolate dehydrogenase/5,10-methenyltetrahydrofolate cyclohydrolase n=1 Tax=uncultured Veillonella sp. TaxID=159268 RepID=UPI0025ED7D21|nr:bifunctional 5,10-methylenetetrahydrofolate dehydrogenase/5,10-methenyltetrahydrofolate cyclohydrolase [uncultured Veillonella sp.]MDY3973218.1 bifunctional 5,10-methylenetetrahydrofolate dehydrogenase/5,10-methenyltetrahydrofolate cyclohydrolase [Veillonella caviae]
MLELRGKVVADAHKAKLNEKLEALKAQGIVLTLGILLVGDDKAAQMYAHFMEKTAKAAGFGVELAHLPATASFDEVAAVVTDWNKADHVYGVLPLMPMPAHIDKEAILDLLVPEKDIDGLTSNNIGLVVSGKGGFWPCTPRACMAILDHYEIPLHGKDVVVVGRSQVIGKPIALMLLERQATVTICHSKTVDLGEKLRRADIVIAAAGRAHMIDGSMLKPEAVVIDVGINDLDGKTVGDVNYESAAAVASAITPVPGGVGSVTTTMLLENIYEAYHARNVDC